MVVMVAGPSEALGESVGNLARELGELARDDPRFEHAADLATELKDEIERAMDPSQPAPTRRLVRGRIRRRIKRRAPRAGSSAPPTLEAYQLEYEALTTVIQHADAE